MSTLLLAGGVGGGRYADGLHRLLGSQLTILANIGDDFDWLSLRICPDLDSILFHLADLAPIQRGWGIDGDTEHAAAFMAQLGAPNWFQLGDQDLGLQIYRTHLLKTGHTLTQVTAQIAQRLGIQAQILPPSDDSVPTLIQLCDGQWISFQEYFVQRRHQDPIQAVQFQNAPQAQLSPQVLAQLEKTTKVLIAPSNPIVSIDPILAIGGLRQWLQHFKGPRIAISPLIGGKALKGPAAHMMQAIGRQPNVLGIAQHYQGLIDTLIIDQQDQHHQTQLQSHGIRTHVTDTIMHTPQHRIQLARTALEFH